MTSYAKCMGSAPEAGTGARSLHVRVGPSVYHGPRFLGAGTTGRRRAEREEFRRWLRQGRT